MSLDCELERQATDNHVHVRAPRPRADASRAVAAFVTSPAQGTTHWARLAPRAAFAPSAADGQVSVEPSQGGIVKQIHAVVSVGDPVRYHIVRAGQALRSDASKAPVVTGRVASNGLSDKLKGAFYAVIGVPWRTGTFRRTF
jgi:hypothetical protein